MPDTYIAIMLQSLEKKEKVLTEITRLNDVQKDQLERVDCSVDDFDETVEAKSKLIEQLEYLDSGFEKLYAQVAEELQQNPDSHASEIRKMQDLIRKITDDSVLVQAQEARNKRMMTQKFATVKRQAQSIRMNSKAITGYYKTMDRTRFMDPQFLETKS